MTQPQLCRNCRSWFLPKTHARACPFCGHEGPPIDADIDSERPSVGQLTQSPTEEPFPWRELSPSLAFVGAIALIGAGIAARSFALLAVGFAAIPCAVVVAAVLESLADRKATADMPVEERQERDRLKVAEAVNRGFLPGTGVAVTGTQLRPLSSEERPRRKAGPDVPAAPSRSLMSAARGLLAAIVAVLGGGD